MYVRVQRWTTPYHSREHHASRYTRTQYPNSDPSFDFIHSSYMYAARNGIISIILLNTVTNLVNHKRHDIPVGEGNNSLQIYPPVPVNIGWRELA